MKNILFYTDTPNLGGAEKQMLLLAQYLSRQGYKISLAYGAYSKIRNIHNEFAKVCKAIYVLPALHKHDPRHYSRLKKILRAEEFDLVHLHLWNPGSCRYGFFAAHHIDVPIVTTEHDPFPLSGIKRKIKLNCLGKTARTIVISSDNYRLLASEYGQDEKRLNLVHNGIEMDKFLVSITPAKLPVNDGDIVVSCIAELHPRKGHRYLLDAFRTFSQTAPRLKLMIVGTGPAEIQLREKYSDLINVHFLGWRDDIPEILKASDIFILPSLKEAFGLVLLEAMASGVIAIGTNSGGTPDIIQSGKTGILIPPADTERIVEAVFTILQNPDRKKAIEKAALEHVRQNFTAEKMAEETIKVYKMIF